MKRLLCLYHRRLCALSLMEAATWWVYADPDYYRFHHAVAMQHARKMMALA